MACRLSISSLSFVVASASRGMSVLLVYLSVGIGFWMSQLQFTTPLRRSDQADQRGGNWGSRDALGREPLSFINDRWPTCTWHVIRPALIRCLPCPTLQPVIAPQSSLLQRWLHNIDPIRSSVSHCPLLLQVGFLCAFNSINLEHSDPYTRSEKSHTTPTGVLIRRYSTHALDFPTSSTNWRHSAEMASRKKVLLKVG